MIITTWEYPDSTIHPTLPRTWGQVSGITTVNAERHGFTRIETEVPDPPETPTIHMYSKLRLYDALVAEGIWEEVKATIQQAGQWERYEQAINLSTDYAPFATLLASLRTQYGDEVTDRVLNAAEM